MYVFLKLKEFNTLMSVRPKRIELNKYINPRTIWEWAKRAKR